MNGIGEENNLLPFQIK